MSQSLTKFAHIDGNQLFLSSSPTTSDFKQIKAFLESKARDFEFLHFTGGKSFGIFEEYSEFLSTKLIDEFECNVDGIKALYSLNKNKVLPESLIVTIGTGTSMILYKNGYSHIGGSALGGGFFMGIAHLLYNISDYHKAISIASKGNRYNVDLKVGDIYNPNDNRVDRLFRQFTASSFGKISESNYKDSPSQEDLLASVVSLIGENIGLIACLTAENHEIKNIIICGGFLINNKILRSTLNILGTIRKLKIIHLKNSEFCGALGALLHQK